MPNITVNVTENPDSVLKTLEETIPENSLDSLISALKTIKETSNAYMTELVNRQNSTEAPAQTSKTENHTEEEDSEEETGESGAASSPKKAKTS